MRQCEICEEYDISKPAVEVIWSHKMHNSNACGYIRVCRECLNNGVKDYVDPNCPSCSVFYQTDRQLTRDFDLN